MNNTRTKKSFTLPEVLVSIAVIVMVVMAATNLLVASIRANAVNINTLIAYGLAQQGVEAVRNIRDSDWLLGANFQGQIGRQNITPWGESFPSNLGETRFYTIDRHEAPDMDVTSISQLENIVPWTLKELSGDKNYGTLSETALYKKAFGSNKEVHYTHESQLAEATPFHRYLMVSPVQYAVGEARSSSKKVLRVACIVEWDEYDVRHSVRLDTELTDWKNN